MSGGEGRNKIKSNLSKNKILYIYISGANNNVSFGGDREFQNKREHFDITEMELI